MTPEAKAAAEKWCVDAKAALMASARQDPAGFIRQALKAPHPSGLTVLVALDTLDIILKGEFTITIRGEVMRDALKSTTYIPPVPMPDPAICPAYTGGRHCFNRYDELTRHAACVCGTTLDDLGGLHPPKSTK